MHHSMTQYWSKSSKAEFPYGAYFSSYFVKENNPVGKLGLIHSESAISVTFKTDSLDYVHC